MLAPRACSIKAGSAVEQSRSIATLSRHATIHGPLLSPRRCAHPTSRPAFLESLLPRSYRGSVSCRYYEQNQQGERTEELELDRAPATAAAPLVAIAVDGTDASRLALAWAVDQLLCSGAPLPALHAVALPGAWRPLLIGSGGGRADCK
jgi:hypothetical protein